MTHDNNLYTRTWEQLAALTSFPLIVGLVINSVYVLEQIADGEDKVSYIGNVVMEIRPLRHFHR